MLNLSQSGPKYIIVAIGTIILKSNNTCIKCELCGTLCEGATQQDQISKLFKCLDQHIPDGELYEVYEQRGSKIITSINRESWEKARKTTKYYRKKV